MIREHSAEQLLALAVAVGERRVEERAPEFDRSLERRDRFVIVRTRPPAHAPQAVADFGHGPAQPAELAHAHLCIVKGPGIISSGNDARPLLGALDTTTQNVVLRMTK